MVSSMTSPAEIDAGTPEDAAAEVENALGRLIERGYKFVHPRDAQGEIISVVGVRVHGTVVDVVRLDAEDEVTAMRMPADEVDVLAPTTLLWRREGHIREVVDALLELPDSSASQSLSRGATGRGCWVSGPRGRAKWLRATA